jgi:hypothetical protein
MTYSSTHSRAPLFIVRYSVGGLHLEAVRRVYGPSVFAIVG